MGWFTGCVLYSLIWWVVLFAVLPIGVQSREDPDPVTGWRGAPLQPRMWRKVAMTTLAAAVVWAGCVAVIKSPYLSFRNGWLAIPAEK
jgi:predicted secreted protein